jgi:hypothetical protein
MSKPATRPALPADAVGFIARRQDRPDRLALFNADGGLSNTFGVGDTLDGLRGLFVQSGMTVDAAGIVRRVG